MNEEVDFIIESTEEDMQGAIKHLRKQYINIRAGKASPAMLHGVLVPYYGSKTPLPQVSNINTPDSQTISVQPFERSLIQEIEKAIMNANLGFNPMNNGDSVIINVPPLTEERRKELSKQAKSEAEEAKIGIRNTRRNANAELKKSELSEDMLKDAEDTIQQLTDKYIIEIDRVYDTKDKEIMTI